MCEKWAPGYGILNIATLIYVTLMRTIYVLTFLLSYGGPNLHLQTDTAALFRVQRAIDGTTPEIQFENCQCTYVQHESSQKLNKNISI
jgi:hypothetical protein